MDKGAWQFTVHGVVKELYATQQVITTYFCKQY